MVSITCPRCGKTSYNLNDVRERYCGFCHVFLDDMPNHQLDRLRAQEIAQLREDGARVSYALDCALQLVECLIAWAPEGTVLPEGVKTCKYRLDEAMRQIARKEAK